MTTGTEALKNAFRDYQVPGLPASGLNDPKKREIRSALDIVALEIEAAAGDQNWKSAARVATTGNVNLASGLASGTIHDGVTVATGDRVLVWKQTDATQNGIYVVPASGAASRASDADTAAEITGALVYVKEGIANSAKQFALMTPSPITLGTTALAFDVVIDQASVNTALLDQSRSISDDRTLTGDELLYRLLTTGGEQFNGATIGYNSRGLIVPSGQTGANSYRTLSLDASEFSSPVGAKLEIKIRIEVSTNYAPRSFNGGLQVVYGSSTDNEAADSITIKSVGNYLYDLRIVYTVLGGEKILRPFFQIPAGSTAFSGEGHIRACDIRLYWLTGDPFTCDTQNDVNVRRNIMNVFSSADILGPAQTFITAGTGGDFGSPGGINQYSIGAETWAQRTIALLDDQTNIVSYPGVDNVNVAAYRRARSTWRGYYAGSTALATIAATSTADVSTTTEYTGLNLTIQNGRYAMHSETGGEVTDRRIGLKYCDLRHLGNDEARAYQTSISADPNAVWATEVAWGVGTASGTLYDARHTRFSGPVGGITGHDNLWSLTPYKKPSEMNFDGCTLNATIVNQPSIGWYNAGSGVMNIMRFVGCSFTGPIMLSCYYWYPNTLADQPADHRTHHIVGYGNVPEVFYAVDFGRALRVRSATSGASSSVTLSGSAVAILFGNVISRAGATGLVADAYGTFDVSGQGVGYNSDVFITSLGKRLGDCSSSAKTLTMTVNGTAYTATFNANHTNQSNATVLAIINAALGANGTADLFDVSQLYYPSFTDEERVLRVSSASGIEKGDVLAFDTDERLVRLMTNSDPAWRFAGVALERALPSTTARVKTKGKMALTYINRSDSGTPSFGATLGIGATAGKIAVTHSGADLFRAIRSAGAGDANDAVSFVLQG